MQEASAFGGPSQYPARDLASFFPLCAEDKERSKSKDQEGAREEGWDGLFEGSRTGLCGKAYHDLHQVLLDLFHT